MVLLRWVNNLTVTNIVGICIMVALFVACIVLIIYFQKRIKRLDGLVGIISSDRDEEINDVAMGAGIANAQESDVATSSKQ